MSIFYNKYPYLNVWYRPNDYTIKVTTKFKIRLLPKSSSKHADRVIVSLFGVSALARHQLIYYYN